MRFFLLHAALWDTLVVYFEICSWFSLSFARELKNSLIPVEVTSFWLEQTKPLFQNH